jgi:outer membrane usher protein
MPARGSETVVLRVVLNGESQGDLFVERTETGDVLVQMEDLRRIGFRDPAGTVRTIDGQLYLSLRSMEGVSFEFREQTLTLEITASPTLLPKREIDFLPARHPNVFYPNDPGGFLNYQVGYNTGDSFSFRSVDGTGQIGLRAGEILLLSDSSFTKSRDGGRFVRLMTNATWDRRETLQRVVAGDFSASSGELGANVTLGGISVSKVYRIDPYFYRYPLANVSGVLPLASELEVYLDGVRIRTMKLPPGGFDLKNLTQYNGSSRIAVVVRDPFGTERRIEFPFYFTDTLLRKGLHEYSYNVGALREEFGSASNQYGPVAFSAFHRYGLSDSVTVGGRAEGAGGVVNLGPEAIFRLRQEGVLDASLSASHDDGEGFGAAGLLRYTYQGRPWNAQAFFKGFSRKYAVIGEEIRPDRTRMETGFGAGYGSRDAGSISLDLDYMDRYDGPDRLAASITYSKTIGWNTALRLSYRKTREEVTQDDLFLGLTWYPGREISLSASYQGGDGQNVETLQVQKNVPTGEGYGYRGSVVRTDASPSPSTTVEPFLQYNGRYGIYTAEYRADIPDDGGTMETARVSAAGGIAYVGGRVGFTRPVTDSFGLVRVDRLQGVRVSLNNQEIGRTDASGEVFLPNLGSYYENQVSINDKDIPIDYSLSEVVRYVSPPLRSGSVIPFEAKKFQAVTGTLTIRRDGKSIPAEYYDVRMKSDGKEIAFPTGKGGEFYLENAAPGRYRGTVLVPGRPCAFEMTIPKSDEMLIELGGLSCEETP